MDIIKEFSGNIASVRADSYKSDLAHVNNLFAVAKEVHPHLEEKDCNIVKYAGQRHRGQVGLEFKSKNCPDGFKKIGSLEPIY